MAASKQGDGDVFFMAAPMLFIQSDDSRRWHINQEVIHFLRGIKCPVAAVAIVGKCRTGKSYLMNRLYGKHSGFELGSTVQSKTKGIWIWTRPHPQDPRRCLILMDTEGLHDVEKGDTTHDMQLFTLTLLLCNCLVYNTIGTFDDVIVHQLHLVLKLTEYIKLNKGPDGESGVYFSQIFPFFFLVLRDFFLELKINGQKVTPDQYLEHSLKPKPAWTNAAREYNAPRECIRAFFTQRGCLILPKPVDDSDKLRHMESVTDADVNPAFLEECQKVVDAVLEKATPFILRGNVINGPRFGEIAQMYVEVMNAGGVPCIESTVDMLKKNECNRALEGASKLYIQQMESELRDKMPVESEVLLKVHQRQHENAVQYYRESALFDGNGEFVEKLSEILESHFTNAKQENMRLSEEKSRQVLQQCFAELEKAVQDGIFTRKAGGYSKYRQLREEATGQYQQMQNLGPMKQNVLNDYLQNTRSTEEAIIAADKALDESEKKLVLEQEQLQREAAKRQAAEENQQELRIEFERQQAEHDSLMTKMQADFEKKQRRMLSEHEADMAEKEKEYGALMAQGLKSQAEQYKMIIDEMKEDRKRMQKSYEDQVKAVEAYKAQQNAIVEEMRKERELNAQQLRDVHNQLAGLRQPQRGGFEIDLSPLVKCCVM